MIKKQMFLNKNRNKQIKEIEIKKRKEKRREERKKRKKRRRAITCL